MAEQVGGHSAPSSPTRSTPPTTAPARCGLPASIPGRRPGQTAAPVASGRQSGRRAGRAPAGRRVQLPGCRRHSPARPMPAAEVDVARPASIGRLFVRLTSQRRGGARAAVGSEAAPEARPSRSVPFTQEAGWMIDGPLEHRPGRDWRGAEQPREVERNQEHQQHRQAGGESVQDGA